MCAIYGIVSSEITSEYVVRKAINSMNHRGPDDQGIESFVYGDDKILYMAHRRLSIIDLSENGHQPMHSINGDVSIVFNGEIYNYQEIREQAPYNYASNSDTEVIIAAYLKWGKAEFINHLNGMFAFAIFDKRTGEIIIARDRLGVKPLYFYYNDDMFVFSSELKGIYISCKTLEINDNVIGEFLLNQYIPAPNTIIKDCYQLLPGHMLVYSNGKIKINRYWDLREKFKFSTTMPYEEAMGILDEKLNLSVSMRLRADVDVGVLLSGGIDSSLVTAIACQHKNNINTYSIGFNENKFDESKNASAVAERLGTKHHELIFDQNEMLKLIDDMNRYYDEPYADDSLLPSMLVSKMASDDLKVVLTGDGGDEFFCGYGHYNLVRKLQIIDPLAGVLYRILRGKAFRRVYASLSYNAKCVLSHRDERFKIQYGGDAYVPVIKGILGNENAKCRIEKEDTNIKDWRERSMLFDIENYLPSDILVKMDRASMKYSLETRNPLLDKNVVEFAMSLPLSYKVKGKTNKRILRDILYRYVPRELVDRPKQGFNIPIDKYLRGGLREKLEFFTSEKYLENQGIFVPQYTSELVHEYIKNGDGGMNSGQNYSRIIWPLFCFQSWYDMYKEYLDG